MLKAALALLILGFGLSDARAERVAEGLYAQTDSNVGACPRCEIRFVRKTKDIFDVIANNRWQGVAAYDSGRDDYEGFIQWDEGTGGAYDGYVHRTEWRLENRVLTMTARSPAGTIIATYRRVVE